VGIVEKDLRVTAMPFPVLIFVATRNQYSIFEMAKQEGRFTSQLASPGGDIMAAALLFFHVGRIFKILKIFPKKPLTNEIKLDRLYYINSTPVYQHSGIFIARNSSPERK